MYLLLDFFVTRVNMIYTDILIGLKQASENGYEATASFQ